MDIPLASDVKNGGSSDGEECRSLLSDCTIAEAICKLNGGWGKLLWLHYGIPFEGKDTWWCLITDALFICNALFYLVWTLVSFLVQDYMATVLAAAMWIQFMVGVPVIMWRMRRLAEIITPEEMTILPETCELCHILYACLVVPPTILYIVLEFLAVHKGLWLNIILAIGTFTVLSVAAFNIVWAYLMIRLDLHSLATSLHRMLKESLEQTLRLDEYCEKSGSMMKRQFQARRTMENFVFVAYLCLIAIIFFVVFFPFGSNRNDYVNVIGTLAMVHLLLKESILLLFLVPLCMEINDLFDELRLSVALTRWQGGTDVNVERLSVVTAMQEQPLYIKVVGVLLKRRDMWKHVGSIATFVAILLLKMIVEFAMFH